MRKKTEEKLYKALVMLLENDDYEKVTILQICQEAGVNRSTFYRKFKSKDDLLRWKSNQLVQIYIHELNELGKVNMDDVVVFFYQFWIKYKSFILMLQKQNMQLFLLNEFNRHILNVHQSTREKFQHNLNEEYMMLSLSFNVGGLWNMLLYAIENNYSEEEFLKGFQEIKLFYNI